jgi:ribosome-binding protein aMBF1 (putative translation factor)
MKECYSCGVSEDKAKLYEGVHRAFGVVYVCNNCYFKEKIPLVDTKKIDISESEKRLSVRERLSLMAGIKPGKSNEEAPKRHVFTPEDIGLKDIVEKNIKKGIETGPKSADDLIDNWNWIIMRKRRSLKISYSQLADELKEQAVILEALEKGKLPRDYSNLIRKLENFLHVRLFKERRRVDSDELIVESRVPSGILISELKEKTEEKTMFSDNKSLDVDELNLDKVREITGEPKDRYNNKKKNEVEDKNLDDLTDDEINDLIFGRKK